jgi:hypothetical protein
MENTRLRKKVVGPKQNIKDQNKNTAEIIGIKIKIKNIYYE